MLSFRPLLPQDQALLWDWLHIALWDPPPAPLRPREVLQHPGVRIYAEGWGRPGDVGLVALRDGQAAGACWMRVLPEGVGLASVDAVTPQLGIGLMPAFQRQGIGKPLMRATLDAAWAAGHPRVALTVHPENPARRLYAACGFEESGLRGSYHLMVATRPR
jgi:GNAT superfamily N-acetyltransferase